MKIAVTIARFLMGLMFVVFGLNGFLNFIPAPPMPDSPMKTFYLVTSASGYLVLPFLLQISSGVLFLVNRYVPLALVLIGPVIVNILMFHITMNPSGIGPGVVVTIFWLIVAYNERAAFEGIFQARART